MLDGFFKLLLIFSDICVLSLAAICIAHSFSNKQVCLIEALAIVAAVKPIANIVLTLLP